jgi:hypothetical protein
LVLVRLQAQDQNGLVSPGAKLFSLGIVDFDTGGQERPAAYALGRGLDSKSAADGWYFMLLEPGTHYLVAGGTRIGGGDTSQKNFEPDQGGQVRAIRARVDVPQDVGVVYAGSLRLSVTARRGFFEREFIAIDDTAVSITDESEAAAALVADKVPWAGASHTSLMSRHRQPTLQFRTADAAPAR